MKRIRFPLESVLTLRKFKKMRESSSLARAVRKRVQQEGALHQCDLEIEDLQENLRQTLREPVTSGKVIMLHKGLGEQRIHWEKIKKSLQEALIREKSARDALLVAQQEYEGLLRLEEKHREETLKEAEREDERAMEEFVMARRALELKG